MRSPLHAHTEPATGERWPRAATLVLMLGVLFAASVVSPSCSQPKMRPKGEFVCRVAPNPDGHALTASEIRAAADTLDLQLARLGFAPRQVAPLPGAKLRVVISEVQAGRMDEIRALLADPALGLLPE